jgi:hypothetical protein
MNLSITLLSHRVRLCLEPSLFNTLHTTGCYVLVVLRTTLLVTHFQTRLLLTVAVHIPAGDRYRPGLSFLLMPFSCTNLRFYPQRKFRTTIAQYTITRSMLWIILLARKVQLYPLLSPISYLIYTYNHVLAIQSNISGS